MSARSKKSLILWILAASFVLAASLPVVLAEDPSCVQACLERWQAERKACDDAKTAVFANIDNNEQACLASCPPSNYMCQGKCMREAEIKRRAYNGPSQRCLAQANTIGWNCYRDCTMSRSRP